MCLLGSNMFPTFFNRKANKMKQRDIIKYFNENGGLRCKDWTIRQIRIYLKALFGRKQYVYKDTCRELKRMAEMYQR